MTRASLLALGAAVATAAAAWILVADSGRPRLRWQKTTAGRPNTASRDRAVLRKSATPVTGSTAVTVALAAGVAVALTTAGLIPAICLAGVLTVARRRRRAATASRQARGQRVEEVTLLRALAAELRAGLPPEQALRAAAHLPGRPGSGGGLRDRMLSAAASAALGGDVSEVLGTGSTAGSPAAALAAAWAVCGRTGARLAPASGRIADGASADLRIAREAESALASARASARILAVLPAAGVGLGSLSGTGTLRVLLFTPFGHGCLLGGIALDLAGLAWLDRLARAAGR